MRVRFYLAGLAVVAAFAASMSLAAAQRGALPSAQLDRFSFGDTNDVAAPQLFSAYEPLAIANDTPFQNFKSDLAANHLLAGGTTAAVADKGVDNIVFSAPLTEGLSLNFAYNLDRQSRFGGYDLQHGGDFDGLFLSPSAVSAPYAAFDGNAFVGATIALARDLHLSFGRSMMDNGGSGYDAPVFSYLTQARALQNRLDRQSAVTSQAGLDWNFARWGGLGLTASNTLERRDPFGNAGLADSASTNAVGVSARVGFGSGWVTTVSYGEGITQLDLRSTKIPSGSDTAHSRAYSVAIAKHGLFANNDSLGLAVSRPLQSFSGGLGLTADLGDFGGILSSSALTNRSPETDFEMGYVTTFFDGALALQANAAWQQNLAGQPGVNSLAVLSRAKINF
jgi:hypothetical protein